MKYGYYWNYIERFLDYYYYRVKREHSDKYIRIREYSESLARYFLQNPFTVDNKTPYNNIPLPDVLYGEDIFDTCSCIDLSIFLSCYVQ